ncbi:DMT family transporter [Pedobacter sp.]|uniref:DMT family transporter n=1 Tax=Pedobacter sp. TaxID=1411316 RepID=UPI002C438CAA|nr:DMT family transporter [Pedobacter sp.]HWW39409.1 DMT family transporter [Pedobacter sp.]
MKTAYIKLHIALILAGFTGIFGRLITLNEGLLSWYRMLISGVVMLIYLTFSGKQRFMSSPGKFKIAATGSILGLHWVFFYGSIKYSNISVGVVCFALTSFFNAILAPAINKKRLSVQELLLSGLTLCGIGLIFGMDASYRTGILLGVVSSIFGALYTIFNERLTKVYKSETMILHQMLGGFLGLTLLMPLFLAISPVSSFLPSLADLGWLLVLSILCTIVMYLLIIDALRVISSFTVSLTFNLEPLYTILLAIVIYHENKSLSIGFYAGCTLILLSLALQMYRTGTQRKLAVN